jgi:5-methylcytosine-specific restriction protein A
VTVRQRNPNWTRDELVVALDFYLRHRTNPPPQTSDAIAELSRNLNRIATAHGLAGDATLRNANGAYMKLMNFRSLDPLFTARGRAGLCRIGARDRQIWQGFSADPNQCRLEAQQILAKVNGE